MLQEINDNPTIIDNYRSEFLLKVVFAHAFLPTHKMVLPEGEPPFKPADQPIGMTDTNLHAEAKRMAVFIRKDLTPIKRETLFVGLLESIHPSEAKVLIAMKDQKLTKLYKNITHKLVSDAGFIPAPAQKEKATLAT